MKNKKYAMRIRRASKSRNKFKQLKILRLVVHRTSRHIYAQIISSNSDMVIVTASTLEKRIAISLKYTGNKIAAAYIGNILAKRAIAKGIKKIAFDRSGFKYHGRIKSLADSARNAGLLF
ncbi:50S ribosomal protein L18 [Buchnera aphidicola (Thelaxes suberi)]